MCCLSDCFQNLIFIFFINLNIKCLGAYLVELIVFRVFSPSYIYRFMSLAKVGKFSILHQVFIWPGIISSLVLRLWWLNWNIFLQSHRSLRLHFIFSSLHSLWVSDYTISVVLSSDSLNLSSVSSNFLFTCLTFFILVILILNSNSLLF